MGILKEGADVSSFERFYRCRFNFEALAQGNAYKPIKEPINYRGSGGDWTHDLQTKATPPVASCPARSLHATEIVSIKHNPNDIPEAALDNWQPVWNAQLSISTPVRVNYANPVYGVATICHQVRWLRWGHPSLFHTATSRLIWYKMFCVRDKLYRLIWMEFINMFSVYAKSRTHSRFNW